MSVRSVCVQSGVAARIKARIKACMKARIKARIKAPVMTRINAPVTTRIDAPVRVLVQALIGALLATIGAPAQSASAPIKVRVDVTDAPRKILHAQLAIPVQPGPLTLVYPKWIPGEHGPTGPIENLAGLVISAGGKVLDWQRDDVNMYAFHVDVPAGVSSLDVKLDFLATADASGFSAGASTSAVLAMVSWNSVILYPDGKQADTIFFQPSATLPAGWSYGTGLTRSGGDDSHPAFETVSAETLIDSPLLAGKYFKEFPLAPEITPKHFLDLAADGPEDLALKPGAVAAFSNLIRETGALYRSRHYNSYHFLVTLSDQVAHFGLEHHQSSDDRVPEKTFLDDNLSLVEADLLPHEFTHSWNGKYRRPAGLATGNYEGPMKGELLWVYEGLTQYLGDVLSARSHIQTSDQYKDTLAASAAILDHRPGRSWRNVQDTATAAQTLYGTGSQWDNWRLSVDYYAEGELIWLDADTTIRKLTDGKKSLDDFVGAFYGVGGNTAPKVVPYSFEDVVAALNGVVKYDWASFLNDRLNSKAPRAPLGGITSGGYRIVYTETPSSYSEAAAAAFERQSFWYSLGVTFDKEGKVRDVLVGSPADIAGIGPGMTVVAVNGRQYSASLLKDALSNAKTGSEPLEFIVANTSYYKVIKINYHDGLRYPHLERVNATPALLDDILKPLTTAPGK